ncbi:hypothetical protein TARUN_2568 [Trichoderma arundinaceum]|uniref:Uncharacterized protein n=1 Tax=Trichoderma arundinaceum TaxID=490622 RepID=A0A395NUK0_TRIAR|nr:hypothetical protein TARUN_2568 [Trichoderma arundinaceum]
MPAPNTTPLAENRAAAKRQAVTTVSVVALIFILWPERFIILRNLCLVPVLAWLTALVFDLKHGALDAWDGVPAWLKRIMGADDNSSGSGASRMAPRHEQSRTGSETVSDYVLMHLGDTVSLIKSEAVRLWGIIRPILAEWIRQAIHLLNSQRPVNQTSPSGLPQKPAPEFAQYYGILVKLPRGPNVTPPFVPPFLMRDIPARAILRESKDVSAIPSVLSSWDGSSRLSFFLVEKSIWDDRSLTLRRKLATGTYWNMSAQGRGNLRKEMDMSEVGQISGIEVLGLGDGEYDALKKCRQCFRVLCQDWKYMRMLWDDVDFAVILGLLAMGPAAATKSVKIYRALCKLKAEQTGAPKQGGPNIDPFLLAAAAGGLAAPFMLPLMAGGWAAMKSRSGAMPEQRRKAYRCLIVQFPELKVLFEEEELAYKDEAKEKRRDFGVEDTDEEWKDEGDDYYNDAFNPFEW